MRLITKEVIEISILSFGDTHSLPLVKELQMEYKTPFQKILTRLPAFGFSSIPADLITLI